jgi:gluconokinase
LITDRTSSQLAIIAMGVSGCGKSTMGHGLANAIPCPFIEGDDHHPLANVAKMQSGIPLSDTDRWPWLQALSQAIRETTQQNGCVVASCSALKRAYRDFLREQIPVPTVFLLLDVPQALLERRLSVRQGHYMPVKLLASQLEALETLTDEEGGFILNGTHALPTLVSESLQIVRRLQTTAPGGSLPAK